MSGVKFHKPFFEHNSFFCPSLYFHQRRTDIKWDCVMKLQLLVTLANLMVDKSKTNNRPHGEIVFVNYFFQESTLNLKENFRLSTLSSL